MDAKVDDRLGLDWSEPTPEEMNTLLFRIMCGVNAQFFRTFGNKVMEGPFAGMEIAETGPWDDGNSSTKLLGCYEFELHETILHACWRRPKVVVNVGCAEGFYAIGLARMLPQTTIAAMDINLASLRKCEEMAERNGVWKQIEFLEGARSPQELVLPGYWGHRLYLVDVEGAELGLLDKDICPVLQHSDIIVECHDFFDRDTSYKLAERFGPTHRVELIRPRFPRLDQFKFLATSPTVMSALAAVEKRPMPCCWLACWATVKDQAT